MIKQHNRTRQQNPKDPFTAQQNTNTDKEIQNHKQALWKQHITENCDHKTNTHTLWKTINGYSTQKKTPQTPNITITFNNKTEMTDSRNNAEIMLLLMPHERNHCRTRECPDDKLKCSIFLPLESNRTCLELLQESHREVTERG